jgi:hypothetical protein
MKPAYVPFKTFLAAIEGFERGLPSQLDRSLWPSYSGAIQGQLLNAFRFMGLVDEGHVPTAELRDLVSKRDARRQLLRAILERCYAPVAGLDLARSSPRQLDEAMRQYGLTGVTHKKALSFFLRAASFAGLPLSPLLKGRTRGAAAPRRPAPAPAAAPAAGSLARTVRLRSGGTLTVSASVDMFALAEDDRKLLFDLIDRLRDYEGRPGTA